MDVVVVGADRIAANGDTANKIGTYMVAVLAKEHDIPFYVAAPISTLDLSLQSGEQIPIEERNSREITHMREQQLGPETAAQARPRHCRPSQLSQLCGRRRACRRRQ